MVALNSSYQALANQRKPSYPGPQVPPELVSETTVHQRAFALIRSLEERDFTTFDHSRRVAVYARKLARALGLAKPEAQQFGLIGMLHDIGKMWVGEILTKDGLLTDAEFERIKSHAPAGEQMIRAYDLPAPFAAAVRHHHESFDGRGYPDGLQGAAIPLAARIITIVDAFDVITSDRPYKKAATLPEAFREIARHAGTQFDPAIAQVFINFASHAAHFLIAQRSCPVFWAKRDDVWYQIGGKA